MKTGRRSGGPKTPNFHRELDLTRAGSLSQIKKAQSNSMQYVTSYPNVDRVRVVHSDYENTALLDREPTNLDRQNL